VLGGGRLEECFLLPAAQKYITFWRLFSRAASPFVARAAERPVASYRTIGATQRMVVVFPEIVLIHTLRAKSTVPSRNT
jgi:hypothetical protein